MSTEHNKDNVPWRGIVIGLLLLVVTIVGGTVLNWWMKFDTGREQRQDGPVYITVEPQIWEGKDTETGLIVDTHWELVKGSCVSCHSAKLITQNRMSRAGWETTIRWMQETQNLGNLYDNEPKILDYLAKNYAPKQRGRRPKLENIEWYELEE